jgi:hypothetical protein
MSILLNKLQQLVAGTASSFLLFDRDSAEKVGKTAGLLVATYVVTTASVYCQHVCNQYTMSR